MKRFIISGALMSSLIKKAGLAEKEAWKKILEGEGDTELTQEQYNELTAAMLSLTDAMEHPEVINGLKGKIFQPTEDRLKEILKANGVSEDDAKKLLDGKPNADKIAAAFDKLKEVAGKAAGTDQDRENQWKATKKELETAANEWKAKYESEASARETDRNDAALTSFLSNPDNFKLRSDMPVATQLRIAKIELTEALAAKGAKIVSDGKGGVKTVYANEPEKEYYEAGNASPYDFKAGATAILDTAGLLNKQPGATSKEEVITPAAGGATTAAGSQAAAAFASNHAALMASIQQ